MNIYYSDDEMRKQGELLAGKPFVTGQETVTGSARSLRLDLWKKHMSGDPMGMRLPYSIVTRMTELIGLKRYEMNTLPVFEGVNELVFNSVMRRAWVCEHLATFVDAQALARIPDAKRKGFFLKDDTAKDLRNTKPYYTI